MSLNSLDAFTLLIILQQDVLEHETLDPVNS